MKSKAKWSDPMKSSRKLHASEACSFETLISPLSYGVQVRFECREQQICQDKNQCSCRNKYDCHRDQTYPLLRRALAFFQILHKESFFKGPSGEQPDSTLIPGCEEI